MHTESTHTPWAAPICHPASVGAVLLLALNDHWLKGAGVLPPLVTGKLSDACGLFFVPALGLALVRGAAALSGRPALWRLARARALVWALAGATGLGFGLANLAPRFNAWLAGWFGVKVMDPSDLLALPALALAAWFLTRFTAPRPPPRPRPLSRFTQLATVSAALLALSATSAPRYVYPRDYARWALQPTRREQRVGPLRTVSWVSATGKSGLGLSICAHNAGQQPAALRVVAATAVLAASADEARRGAGQRVTAAAAPQQQLAPGQSAVLHVPFVFDNQAAWNAGQRAGLLQLTLVAGDRRAPCTWPLLQSRPRYHRRVERGMPQTPQEEASAVCAPRVTPPR